VYKITILSQQHYYSTLPVADPSLKVISTNISSDALLLSVILSLNVVSLSVIEYCDWLNDTTASIGN